MEDHSRSSDLDAAHLPGLRLTSDELALFDQALDAALAAADLRADLDTVAASEAEARRAAKDGAAEAWRAVEPERRAYREAVDELDRLFVSTRVRFGWQIRAVVALAVAAAVALLFAAALPGPSPYKRLADASDWRIVLGANTLVSAAFAVVYLLRAEIEGWRRRLRGVPEMTRVSDSRRAELTQQLREEGIKGAPRVIGGEWPPISVSMQQFLTLWAGPETRTGRDLGCGVLRSCEPEVVSHARHHCILSPAAP